MTATEAVGKDVQLGTSLTTKELKTYFLLPLLRTHRLILIDNPL